MNVGTVVSQSARGKFTRMGDIRSADDHHTEIPSIGSQISERRHQMLKKIVHRPSPWSVIAARNDTHDPSKRGTWQRNGGRDQDEDQRLLRQNYGAECS